MWTAMQGVFLLVGIALVVAGLNASRPLVIAGFGLMLLAVLGRVLGRKGSQA